MPGQHLPLRVFNTLSGRKELFEPRERGQARMYVCGPTVYDYIHLGHARTYVTYDIMARYLRHLGYQVTFVVNITDVDERVFRKAHEQAIDYHALATQYLEAFLEDLAALKVTSITAFPRASDHVAQVIALVTKLEAQGYAYRVNGDVYMNTTKLPTYGSLSNQTQAELKLRRLDPDPRKKTQADFLLWRSCNEEPAWESPFGRGRPGWHIQDTAMSLHSFGDEYDIHGGGVDLIFPHHEAQLAQGAALTGRRSFITYWIHMGTLKVRDRKMSKSFGNYITVKQILRLCSTDLLRLFFAMHHYRKSIDFAQRHLKPAERILKLLQRALAQTPTRTPRKRVTRAKPLLRLERVGQYEDEFYQALDDDFNTPKAVRILIALSEAIIGYARKGGYDEAVQWLQRRLRMMLSILGILETGQPAQA